MEEIQKANAAARTKTIALMSVVCVIGLGLIAAVETYQSKLTNWIEANAMIISQNPSVVIATLIVLFAPLYVAGYYVFSLGSRIARAKRFPPPGQAVVRDTIIATGVQAVMRGRILQMLSVAMALTITIVIFLAWNVLNEIASTN